MSKRHTSTTPVDLASGQFGRQSKTASFPGSPDLREIVASTGERWLTFRKTLTPKFFVVWRDIAICYLAILGAVGLLCAASGNFSPFPLLIAAPLFTLWLGYWLASLNNFMHEAAHHNLAQKHSTNDVLANIFVTSLFGMDIKDYREVHWQHHLHLGHEGDTEVSYRNRPTIGMLVQTATGIYLLRVLLRYRRAGKASRGKTPAKPSKSRVALIRTASIHFAILATLAVLGCYVAAAVWVVTIIGTFPTFATLRQTLEHRSTNADNGAEKDQLGAVRVLDVGGGTGWLLSQVRSMSNRVDETHEVDIDETAGVADAVGELEFTLAPDTVSSSFTPSKQAAAKANLQRRTVPVITLDCLLETHLDGVPDVVKIDAEGFECKIMQSAAKLVGKTEIFLLEAPLIDPPQGWNSFHEISAMMRDLGYEPFEFTGFCRMRNDPASRLCEIAFARRDGFLRAGKQGHQPNRRAA